MYALAWELPGPGVLRAGRVAGLSDGAATGHPRLPPQLLPGHEEKVAWLHDGGPARRHLVGDHSARI